MALFHDKESSLSCYCKAKIINSLIQNKITNKQLGAAHLFLLRNHSVNFNLQMMNNEQTQAYTLSRANNDASVMATSETLEKKQRWSLLSIVARSHFAESTMHTELSIFVPPWRIFPFLLHSLVKVPIVQP